VPFFWALIWGVATWPYVKWAMHKETEQWENDQLDPERKLAEMDSAPPSEPGTSNGSPHTNLDKKTDADTAPETAATSTPKPANPDADSSALKTQSDPKKEESAQDTAIKAENDAKEADTPETAEPRPTSSQ
jgi:hypothetical protein